MSVSSMLVDAGNKTTIEAKREVYKTIFEQITSAEHLSLYCMSLEQFAREVLYNQGPNGFAQSARVMEFSLLLQLKGLNLIDPALIVSVNEQLPLDEILKALENKPELDRFILSCSFDEKALFKSANPILAKTLTLLSFSYQNSLKHASDLKLQEVMQKLTEGTMGNDLVMRIEFTYNRAMFMLNLRNPQATVEDKIHVYDAVRIYLDKLEPSHKVRLEKISQIANMKALAYCRNGDYKVAKDLSYEALEARQALFDSATTESERYKQSFFRANAITVLFASIKAIEEKADVSEYVGCLRYHLDEMAKRNDNNTYRDSYVNAIESGQYICK